MSWNLKEGEHRLNESPTPVGFVMTAIIGIGLMIVAILVLALM